MSVPAELSKALRGAKEQVRSHPKHELALPARKRIWRLMGPSAVDKENHAERTPGLYRRTLLAVYAAELVLPVWERYWPTKDPHHMLDVAKQYLRKEVSWKSAWKTMREFNAGLQNTQGVPADIFYATAAGHAAVSALAVALKDEWCEDDGTLDEDQDDWDASFYACIAFTGDAPWGEKWDANKALQFWDWYLDEAVEKAYGQSIG